MKRPEPFIERIGGLTIVNRTGEPTDVQEFIKALESVDVSHLKRGPRKYVKP